MDRYTISLGTEALALWECFLEEYRLDHFGPEEDLAPVLAQGVPVVSEGYVKQSHLSREGREVITALYGPGHLVGDLFQPNELGERQFATKGPVRVWVVPRGDLRELLEANPRLAGTVLELLSERERAAMDRIADLGLEDVATRTARLLASLMTIHGTTCRHGHQVDIHLTHQELADMVAAARPVVSQILAQWRAEGVIHYTRHFICVEDLPGLESAAACRLSSG